MLDLQRPSAQKESERNRITAALLFSDQRVNTKYNFYVFFFRVTCNFRLRSPPRGVIRGVFVGGRARNVFIPNK